MRRYYCSFMLMLTLLLGAGCSDSYDDAAIKEQLAELERRVEAAEAVIRAYENNLFIQSVTPLADGYEIRFSDGSKATIRNGKDGQPGQPGQPGEKGDSWIKHVIIGDTGVTFEMTDGRSFTIPMASFVQQIQHIAFVPCYDDGKARVEYTSMDDSHLKIDFQISPRELAAELVEKWKEYCKIEAVSTHARATVLDLPIESCVVDPESGIMAFSAKATNLGADFFAGTTSAAATLVLSDGVTTISADYVPLVKEEVKAPAPTPSPVADGLAYIFDLNALPEIHVQVSLSEWNRLLSLYDQNQDTDEYIHCDATFTKDGTTHAFVDAGLRLRGNTSRRRPEGNSGQMHQQDHADWHHCHFMLNLRKYVKDDAHTLGGVRKIHLKWCKDDPTYVREMYCYNLFRRYGIEAGLRTSYSRLWIHVEGDSKAAYYGVYEMLEAVDEQYLKNRLALFGSADHNLWKCGYPAGLNATDDHLFWSDEDAGTINRPYVLKTNTDNFAAAKAQLIDFILKLNGKTGDSFKNWIQQVTDVELLLKTYAVNVAVGMWDDYWGNQNNYYIYFNTSDLYDYKFFFIPYDYDNTLGTSNMMDAGRQDPLNWGDNSRKLIRKLLDYPEWRTIYVQALNELCKSDELFKMEGSVARIKVWQQMISPYISNDTGEDMAIEDKPASWGNHSEYRLMDMGSNNYFRVKASS
ncbi:MAG: CotH kinase family protein, partial [Alistipes sp.]|nr:CotH kinase family protein [Alistipes sp.]